MVGKLDGARNRKCAQNMQIPSLKAQMAYIMAEAAIPPENPERRKAIMNHRE